MRLPFFTLFLCNATLFSLFPTLVSSLNTHAISRRRNRNYPPPPPVLSSRQYHVARDLLDVCINANVDLLADVSQVLGLGSALGALDLGTKIQLCLCLKDLDIYLETNDEIQALIGILGKNAVGALIAAVIDTSPQSKQCDFPPHAHHTCNANDPCHYECDAPYVLENGQCVCAPPNSSCNGVCGLHPQGCGSAVPPSLRKRSNAIVTIAQARASCKDHETVCGIPGQGRLLAFECIDTNSSADSCGGCMTPQPFYEADPIPHIPGQDCTAISNAKSTSCSEQRCVVHSCIKGWVPSSDQAACVLDASVGTKTHKIRNRSNSVGAGTLDSTLVSQLVEIVKLVVVLNAYAPTDSSTRTSSTSSIPSLLVDINVATAALVNSTLIPSSLPIYIDTLLNSCGSLEKTLDECKCVQSLGLSDFEKYLDDLITATLVLHGWLQSHSIASSTPAASSAGGSSSTGAGSPAVVGLTDILTDGTVGLLGPLKSGVTVDGIDGLLGPGTSDILNNLLNGLLIGPANYKRQTRYLLKNANTTFPISIEGGWSGYVETLNRSILNLGGLLNTSQSSSSSSIPVDSALLSSLEHASVILLKSSTLGLLCPTLDALYVTERQLEASLALGGSDYKDAYDELIFIINYTVALQVLCQDGSSGSSATFSITAVTGSSLPPTGRGTSSIPKTTIYRTTSNPTTYLSVSIGSGVRPTSTSVSRPLLTLTSHSASTGRPTVFSHSLSVTATRTAPFPTSSILYSGGVPIVVGLDGLLNGLGLGGVKGVVTVGDGLLGDDTDSSVNNVLDGFGIGPHGVRKRGTMGLKSERRQITANSKVDAAASASVVAAIQQIVDLVLGLNASAIALPSASSGTNSAIPSGVDCGLVDNVVDATLALVSSSAYSQLLRSVNGLVGASVTSLNILEGCSCVDNLGLQTLQNYLSQIVQQSEALLALCPASSPTIVSPVPSQPLPHWDTIEIGLSKLLAGLGLNVKANVVVSGLLGDGLDSTVNNALDALNIGANGMKRRVRPAEM